MKGFRDFLVEGLVKLPPKTEKQLKQFARSVIFQAMEWTIEKSDKPNKDALLAGMRAADVEYRRPRSMKKIKSGNFLISSTEISGKDLPDNYNIPKGIEIQIIIDFDGQLFSGPSHMASYLRKGDMRGVAINMQNDKIFTVFKSRDADSARYNVEYYFRGLDACIEHELTHAIQDIIVPGGLAAGKQVSSKLDYDKNPESYITSKVEFEATIKSELARFKQHVLDMEEIRIRNFDVRADIEKFIGARKYSSLTGCQPSNFFASLKKVAPERYKIAVKKFMIEIDEWLKSRSESKTNQPSS